MNNRTASLALIMIGLVSMILFSCLGEFDVTAPVMIFLLGIGIFASEVYKTLARK